MDDFRRRIFAAEPGLLAKFRTHGKHNHQFKKFLLVRPENPT
jgi:hypothetical protein